MAMPGSASPYGGQSNAQHDNAPLMGQGSYGPQGGRSPPQGSYGPGANYDNYSNPAQSLQKLSTGNHMNDVFFAAAMCIVTGSFIGGTVLLFSAEPVDFIAMTYLMVFGLILAVLDTPFLKTIKFVGDAKMYIGKYIQFVTRVTGKGITFVFLGSALFMTMWDNLEGGFLLFLAVVLSLFPTGVGFCSIVIGVLKSSKLDRARRQLAMVVDQRYDHFAQTYRGPQGGLTMAEFNMLTMENGGFKFETLDLKLIFNALVSNPAWRVQATTGAAGAYAGGAHSSDEMKIPKQDLLDWCKGSMILL